MQYGRRPAGDGVAVGPFFRGMTYAVFARDEDHGRAADAGHERRIVARAAGKLDSRQAKRIGAATQRFAHR